MDFLKLAAGDVLIVRLASGGSFQMHNYFDGDSDYNGWLTVANMKIMINNSLYFRFQSGNATNNCISGIQIK